MAKTKITPEEECFKIIQTIWSCKNDEQKEGCVNMFETYKKKHGEDNLGVTFIKLEMLRLEQIIKLSKLRNEQMKKVQEELERQNKENGIKEPSQEDLKQAAKTAKIMNIDELKNSKNKDKKKK
tara:strand:+ start:4503 stop:4874 length:372 start_codon:yes stop_codon:yes gene_type:complete